ncbi:hypothetical protein, partial [Stenotrophomonas maltophilia]|uniref:hypothetical protein n=1 Tax=Stenotrophomonas maltophilia TaxID=40324 RepID=UPI0021CA1D57
MPLPGAGGACAARAIAVDREQLLQARSRLQAAGERSRWPPPGRPDRCPRALDEGLPAPTGAGSAHGIEVDQRQAGTWLALR